MLKIINVNDFKLKLFVNFIRYESGLHDMKKTKRKNEKKIHKLSDLIIQQ